MPLPWTRTLSSSQGVLEQGEEEFRRAWWLGRGTDDEPWTSDLEVMPGDQGVDGSSSAVI